MFLIFVQGLTVNKDADIHSYIITKLEQNQHLTMQAVAEEYQKTINLQHDASKTEEKIVLRFNRIDK